MELYDLMVEARRIQASQGHAKGMILDGQGRVCMHGALLAAHCGQVEYNAMLSCQGVEASRACAAAMGFASPSPYYSSSELNGMCEWNNDPERGAGAARQDRPARAAAAALKEE